MRRARLLACVLFCSLISVPLAAEEPVFKIKKEDVVAFVGGTDMVRMQKVGWLEASLTHHFRGASPRFRDLAWEGDTVYFQSTVRERWRREAFGQWPDQLKRVGATIVIAQLGKVESLEGVGKLDSFVQSYGKLLDQLSGDERRVVVLAPAPLEWWEHYQESALPDYSRAIEALAKDRGLLFVSCDPEEKDSARVFASRLTGKQDPFGPEVANLRAAVQEKHRLWFEYWRPSNWKCLFGDDSRRIFSKASQGLPSFQEEWATYPALIAAAEKGIQDGRPWKTPDAPELSGSNEADVAKELGAFDVLDGFEVNLFADETMKISNPLSVRWDASGRMFVACSDVYPQVEPGVRANDKIVVLQDTDSDGRADKSAVFADGLKIPTGMEVGSDRVYVGQGTELLTLRDTDGNGVADERKVLLSGFGNGDSHQTINSFVWSPSGELWFCQGDGIESRVETPHGVSTLFQAGVFRLRPDRLQLDGLLDDFMGPGNPWGVAFDDFGQSFVIDGAGGISYLTPASIPAKRRLKLPRIGKPGGYCGVECLGARTLPEDMQGDFLVGDYKRNQISRFATEEDGAGFKVSWKKPLLKSNHRNFRPIDVKMGPDGAIYVVDWYNPITCHQDDFYRHPARDKTHGRIWRISRKGSNFKAPDLEKASIAELMSNLESPERWTRLKAKQVLATRGRKEVLASVRESLRSAVGSKETSSLYWLEIMGLCAWLDLPYNELLAHLLASPDSRVRAYAARMAGRWGEVAVDPPTFTSGPPVPGAHELLLAASSDPHPRVRMEAILGCAQIPRAHSIVVAAAVAEHPRDRWIDYAFAQAVHQLKPQWLPDFREGRLQFGRHQVGLAAVLGQADSKALLEEVRTALRSGRLPREAQDSLRQVLASVGEEADIKLILGTEPASEQLLLDLAQREKPNFEVAPLILPSMQQGSIARRRAAIELAGHWQVEGLLEQVAGVAMEVEVEEEVRRSAVRALGSLGGDRALRTLRQLAAKMGDNLQSTAVAALVLVEPEMAASLALDILRSSERTPAIKEILQAFTEREGASEILAAALGKLKADLPIEQANRLRMSWNETGLVDDALSRRLDDLSGISASSLEFSDALVKELVAAGQKGNALKGEALFHSARAGCAACHQVGDRGGAIGPNLSAVGSGLLPDRIVTEVMWPARQVKEGYALTRVTTKSRQVIQGYLQASRKKESTYLRDFSTNKMHEISNAAISKQETIGSLMPATAQTLSRQEIADLVAYLLSLRGQ